MMKDIDEMKKTKDILQDYKNIWIKEFEEIKNYFAEINIGIEVYELEILEKASQLISLLKKFKRLTNLEDHWAKKNDELNIMISNFKKMLEIKNF